LLRTALLGGRGPGPVLQIQGLSWSGFSAAGSLLGVAHDAGCSGVGAEILVARTCTAV